MTTPTSIGTYDVGDRVITRSWDPAVASSGFRTSAGAEGDPTTVTWRMRLPDGTTIVDVYLGNTTTTPPGGTPVVTGSLIVRAALAHYTREHVITTPGSHPYGWEGDGTIETYEEWEFYARPRRAG